MFSVPNPKELVEKLSNFKLGICFQTKTLLYWMIGHVYSEKISLVLVSRRIKANKIENKSKSTRLLIFIMLGILANFK